VIKKETLLPIERFLATLNIVHKEGEHLTYSWRNLFRDEINEDWMKRLAAEPELGVQLEAFVSRFGRMQDTIADKLLPRWLLAQAEVVGSQIEVLNRAERLDVLTNVEHWLQVRKLRNRLVHEYMESPKDFVDDLLIARSDTQLLITTYHQLRQFALARMGVEAKILPPKLMPLDPA